MTQAEKGAGDDVVVCVARGGRARVIKRSEEAEGGKGRKREAHGRWGRPHALVSLPPFPLSLVFGSSRLVFPCLAFVLRSSLPLSLFQVSLSGVGSPVLDTISPCIVSLCSLS